MPSRLGINISNSNQALHHLDPLKQQNPAKIALQPSVKLGPRQLVKPECCPSCGPEGRYCGNVGAGLLRIAGAQGVGDLGVELLLKGLLF